MKGQKSDWVLATFEKKPELEPFTGFYSILCSAALVFRVLDTANQVTPFLPLFSAVPPVWIWRQNLPNFYLFPSEQAAASNLTLLRARNSALLRELLWPELFVESFFIQSKIWRRWYMNISWQPQRHVWVKGFFLPFFFFSLLIQHFLT